MIDELEKPYAHELGDELGDEHYCRTLKRSEPQISVRMVELGKDTTKKE